MGKKRKLIDALEEVREGSTFEEAGNFLHEMFNMTDRVRTVATTSKKMNEFSEALDDALNILMKMKPEQIQILTRLW